MEQAANTWPTPATITAAYQAVANAHIEPDWEDHPHLTEEEATEVHKIIDLIQQEMRERAKLTTKN